MFHSAAYNSITKYMTPLSLLEAYNIYVHKPFYISLQHSCNPQVEDLDSNRPGMRYMPYIILS